jgi:hypothetical protein
MVNDINPFYPDATILFGLDMIAFVDREKRFSRVVQRLGLMSRCGDLFAQPHNVAPGVTIFHDEIFARD